MNSRDRLDRRDTLPGHLIAPVGHRQVVGEYVVALDGRELAAIDLVADRSVERAGLAKVLSHSFQLLDPKQKKLYVWAAVVIAVLILRPNLHRLSEAQEAKEAIAFQTGARLTPAAPPAVFQFVGDPVTGNANAIGRVRE